MTPRVVRYLVTVVAGALTSPPMVQACGCGGIHSAMVAAKNADVIFVGMVARIDRPKPRSFTNPDGSVSVAFGGGPIVTTFEISHSYLGPPERQVTLTGNGSDCDEPFEPGEVWLVYARVVAGRVVTTKCTRTRLRAEASSDLDYLEGLEQKRPQGIVYGEVLRRVTTPDGRSALQSPFEALTVVAVSDGRRTEVTADKWGPYQIVLPPGNYELWVERSGRPVAAKQSVRVADGADSRLALVVDDKN